MRLGVQGVDGALELHLEIMTASFLQESTKKSIEIKILLAARGNGTPCCCFLDSILPVPLFFLNLNKFCQCIKKSF